METGVLKETQGCGLTRGKAMRRGARVSQAAPEGAAGFDTRAVDASLQFREHSSHTSPRAQPFLA